MSQPEYSDLFKAARARGASAVEADAYARSLSGPEPAEYRRPSEINDEARAMMMRTK